MPATKIATCCYCGTKAALVLKGKTRHELACSACGAPLHVMKRLPKSDDRDRKPDRYQGRQRAIPYADRSTVPTKKNKKKKSKRRKVMSKFWDIVEDVVDEILD